MKSFTMLLAVAVLAALSVAPAMADNPHFIKATAGPTVNSDGTLDCGFKIAGLGDNVTITVTCTANGTAVYACQNNGGAFPQAANKQTVSGPVSASGEFTSGKNGQITDSLTLSPPASTLECPNGQTEVLCSVSYSNVTLSGGGATSADLGTFSSGTLVAGCPTP